MIDAVAVLRLSDASRRAVRASNRDSVGQRRPVGRDGETTKIGEVSGQRYRVGPRASVGIRTRYERVPNDSTDSRDLLTVSVSVSAGDQGETRSITGA